MKMGLKNDIFWSEIESGFEEPGSTPPPRILKSTPGDCMVAVINSSASYNLFLSS